MSKELNIIQAMEMPVGTKFNFDIKENAEFIEVLKGNNGPKILCWDGDRDSQVRVCTSTAEMKLTPIQQSVSFMEAIKSGKRIKVVHERFPNSDKYLIIKDMFWCMSRGENDYPIDLIENGKWYIESEEN